MKKNKTVKTGILVALLLLVVGFAAVSTQLSLNGTASVGANKDDFEKNVKFATAEGNAPTIVSSITEKEGSSVTVSADGKTLTFVTPELNTLNETVTVSYKVINESNYVATLGDLTCTVKNAADEVDTDKYISVTPANGFKNTDVASGATTAEFDTVEVKLIKTYAGDDKASYKIECELPATGKSN